MSNRSYIACILLLNLGAFGWQRILRINLKLFISTLSFQTTYHNMNLRCLLATVLAQYIHNKDVNVFSW